MSRQELWATTAYFNPLDYSRRRSNFRVFRRHLGAPLVAVELSRPDGTFDLTEGDADILLQLTCEPGQVLWQKERLLNIARLLVPSTATCVAWLDCDLVFEDDSWISNAVHALESTPVIQVFSKLYDLPQDVMPSAEAASHQKTATSSSVAAKVAAGTSDAEDFRPTTPKRRGLGFAWAARKSLLDQHGLYDAFILGSGDRGIACGAWGRFEDAIAQVRLNRMQQRHYLDWAKPFFSEVRGRVGFADSTVFHLWHGEPGNRGYGRRHIDFERFEFDPECDISVGSNGCWTLSDRSGLRQFMFDYFASRREDGDDLLTSAAGPTARTAAGPTTECPTKRLSAMSG